MKRHGGPSIALVLCCGLLAGAGRALAYDTVGVDARQPSGFNVPNVVEMRWKSAVSEFDFATPAYLRIEFNAMEFAGPSGATSIGSMIQNLLHQYVEAASPCDPVNIPGGLELYFSTIDNLHITPPYVAGIRLDANPNTFPRFRRIFQNIDGSGDVGNNLYNNDSLATPAISAPVIIEWHIRRGVTVTNPTGNLKKDIACNWTTITGTFREWFIDVTVNGTNYPVATFYVPDNVAQFIRPWNPFTLHQEHFGACNNQLHNRKGDVRYYGLELLQQGSSTWIPAPTFELQYDYGGDCGTGVPSDLRHGLGTAFYNGVKSILSRVGHNNDVSMKRCTSGGGGFCPPGILLSTTVSGNEVAITNVAVNRHLDTATISWNTSRTADGMIRWGTTPNYGTDTAWASTPTTSHQITLTGLQPTTTYYYRVESIDSNAHMATADQSFISTTPHPYVFVVDGLHGIAKLDTANFTVACRNTTITPGSQVIWGISGPSDGSRVYAAISDGTIAEIDGNNCGVLSYHSMGVSCPFPTAVAAFPDGSRLLVVCESGPVLYLNNAFGLIASTPLACSIPTGYDLQKDPTGTNVARLYVACQGSSNGLLVVNVNGNTLSVGTPVSNGCGGTMRDVALQNFNTSSCDYGAFVCEQASNNTTEFRDAGCTGQKVCTDATRPHAVAHELDGNRRAWIVDDGLKVFEPELAGCTFATASLNFTPSLVVTNPATRNTAFVVGTDGCGGGAIAEVDRAG
ncbi:MAG TPA: fibronectin type III domain-containing protein, partial [Candidatus Binatia bacterium]|nr:fibronectin type III domain-containing protein [Candidatus Binatia bacterium]